MQIKVKISSTITEPAIHRDTDQKHLDFINEPIGAKPVTELAGIWENLGARMSREGFDKAYVVFGQFLVFNREKEAFVEWMMKTFRARPKSATACYQCLSDYFDQFA